MATGSIFSEGIIFSGNLMFAQSIFIGAGGEPPVETFNILLESGDALLLENGDNLLLESA